MGFNLIYWNLIYFSDSSNLEKFGRFWENSCFSGEYGWIEDIPHGRIWPDWGL